MKAFEHSTNCAKIETKSYNIKVVNKDIQSFTQVVMVLVQPLLNLLLHSLKISCFNRKQACRLVRHSSFALTMILCCMS